MNNENIAPLSFLPVLAFSPNSKKSKFVNHNRNSSLENKGLFSSLTMENIAHRSNNNSRRGHVITREKTLNGSIPYENSKDRLKLKSPLKDALERIINNCEEEIIKCEIKTSRAKSTSRRAGSRLSMPNSRKCICAELPNNFQSEPTNKNCNTERIILPKRKKLIIKSKYFSHIIEEF